MKSLSIHTRLAIVVGLLAAAALFIAAPKAHAAACTAPSTDYGTVTSTVSIPAQATYRIWSRMAAANTTNNTYLLEIDGNTCYTVGGSGVPVYASGASTHFVNNSTNWRSTTSTGTQIDLNLTAGNHTVKMIGNAPDVFLDRIIFTQDTACTPTGTGDNCASPPDTTPPVAAITSPTAGQTVSSPLTVSVNASDDSGVVSKVELYVDGSSTPTATDTSSPFSFANVTLSPGTHTLRVRAYDAANNQGVSTDVSITVSDTTQPTVSMTAPGNNTTHSGTIALTADATDNVGVTKVEFLVDGAVKATDTSSPYSTSLDTTTLTNGTHTLAAKAYDAANNNRTSTNVTITVNNTTGGGDTTAPTVSVTSPAAATPATVIAGKTYQVSATVTDASGIKEVIVQVDGVTKATLTTAPYVYSLDTTTLSNGAHTIRVRATDNSTAQNTSAYVSVSVRVTDLADVGRNCIVNFSDISAIIPKIGQTGTNLGVWDVNNDNKINFTDISAVVPKLGTTPC